MDHTAEFLQIVNDAKKNINEIDVQEALRRVENGATLVDVREDKEWEAGHAKGALHLGKGVIERDIVGKVPDKETELILYCGGGFRSALAAENIQKMGYANVVSMDGGWKAWKEAGGPVE